MYGVYFVASNSDLDSVSVNAVMFTISCYIEPWYNNTPPYIFQGYLIGNHKTARPSTSEATLKNVGKLD